MMNYDQKNMNFFKSEMEQAKKELITGIVLLLLVLLLFGLAGRADYQDALERAQNMEVIG